MKVVVTGFGPFDHNLENSSTLTAFYLEHLWKKHIISLESAAELIVIPNVEVSYSAVDKLIPVLWESLKPDLVIHIGLYDKATEIYLETKAHSGPYNLLDIRNLKSPVEYFDHSIFSNLSLEEPCKLLNSAGYSCALSNDPGYYLCGYIYLRSLQINPDSTLFIHVPNVSEKCSVEYLAESVFLLIIILAKQSNLDVPHEFEKFYKAKIKTLRSQS